MRTTIKGILWAAVVLGCCIPGAWYVHARLTMRPPLSPDALFEHLRRDEEAARSPSATVMKTAQLAMFQPARFIPQPPPAGMQWDWSASYFGRRGHQQPPYAVLPDVVRGEWTPALRPNLASIMADFEKPGLRQQFQNLVDVAGEPWRPSLWSGDDAPTPNGRKLQAFTWSWCAYARYLAEEHSDPAAAWVQLKTGLKFLDAADCRSAYLLVATQMLADDLLRETTNLLHEQPLCAETRADIRDALAHVPQPFEDLGEAVRGEQDFWLLTLNATFTSDEHGNGWLDLAQQAEMAKRLRVELAWPADRAERWWNVFSVLYNSQAQLRAKLDRICDTALELPRDSLPAASQHLRRAPVLSPCDGLPYHDDAARLLSWHVEQVFFSEARRRATLLVLMLETCKAQHGDYPATLDELTSDESELPMDPFTGGAFRYRRLSSDLYALYSCGRDGKDDFDGHTLPSARAAVSDPDLHFAPLREPTQCEPRAVPVQEGGR